MDDVTRRQAMKLVATTGVAAAGAAALGGEVEAQQKKGEGGQEAWKVTLLNDIEIGCRNILGSPACLYIQEEGSTFFLKATYRGRSARVQIAEGDNEILNVFGIKFKLRVSELSIMGRTISARIAFIADLPIGGDVTIFQDRISVTIPGLAVANNEGFRAARAFEAVGGQQQEAIIKYGDDAKGE